MGCSGLPGLHVTIGASVVLNLYALRDLCSVSVAARDINLLFKELALLAFHPRWFDHHGCLLRCWQDLAWYFYAAGY